MKHREKANEKKKLQNIKSNIFLQFLLILLVILSVILLTSTSLYKNIITGMTLSTLRDAIERAVNVDDDADVIEHVETIEHELSVYIEVYGKNSGDGENEYTRTVYTKLSSDQFYNSKTGINQIKQARPLVGYNDGELEVERTYSDGSIVGKLKNPNNSYEFYVLASPQIDGAYLMVAAVPCSGIEQEARMISITMGLVTLMIFIAISIVGYAYVTQITNPIKKITEYTKEMADENEPELIRAAETAETAEPDSELETSISSIKFMYSSWLLTKQKLAERSEMLLEQLHEKELEKNYREEFISNASHELKTPIAIIQGYAECAKYTLDDKKALEEYCDTIINECAKMNDLVVNMTNLSILHQNENTINSVEFSITDFIAESMALHSMIFEKYGIQSENLITDEIIGRADTKKLPYVFNNLISNAVSYIGGEPKLIRVRYEDVGLSYRIFLFNSGDNISDDVLEKLWLTFYRHDPSRNRSQGHFGLGLSIVKSIQDAHSEQCGVNNAEGGVEFWFDIEKVSLDSEQTK